MIGGLKDKLKEQVEFINTYKNVEIIYSNIFLYYEKRREKNIVKINYIAVVLPKIF